MNKLNVLEYQLKEEVLVEISFDDGMYLQIVPTRKEGSVTGFDSALLYSEKGVLQAMAIDNTYWVWASPEDSGYWSRNGKVEQHQVAAYWKAAIEGAGSADNELRMIVSQGAAIREKLEQGKEKTFGKAEY